MRRNALAFALALATCTLAACGGGTSDTPADAATAPATFKDVQDKIFSVNCTLSACHSESRKEAGLSLVEGKAYANIVNKDPTTSAAKSKGYKLVTPGDSSKSFLYIKCSGPGMNEGDKMPQGGTLSQEKLDLLKRWIDEGAKES